MVRVRWYSNRFLEFHKTKSIMEAGMPLRNWIYMALSTCVYNQEACWITCCIMAAVKAKRESALCKTTM